MGTRIQRFFAGPATVMALGLLMVWALPQPLFAQTLNNGGSNAQLLQRIDQLEAELRRVTGLLEQMQFAQKRMADDAAGRFGDIEFRLTELEGGDTSTLAPPAPLGGEAVTAPSPQTPPAQTERDNRFAEVSVSESNDLERASEDIKQGRYDQGEERLNRFISDYPDSPLKGTALYWLGEGQFQRGLYTDAARSFLSGYKADQTSERAPYNLYRLGTALGRLGQVQESCQTLHEVARQYPGAPKDVLDNAMHEAERLNCGG